MRGKCRSSTNQSFVRFWKYKYLESKTIPLSLHERSRDDSSPSDIVPGIISYNSYTALITGVTAGGCEQRTTPDTKYATGKLVVMRMAGCKYLPSDYDVASCFARLHNWP